MRAALEILGCGPVCHGEDTLLRTRNLEMAAEGVEVKFHPETAKRPPLGRREFDGLLGTFSAITDSPFNHFGPELMAAYPEAKVIIVERDIDDWCRSYSKTIVPMAFRKLTLAERFVFAFNPLLMRRMIARDKMFSLVFDANSQAEILANMRTAYREHYAEIRKAARPGQLLEYKLGSGWDPLCSFLGCPIPDVPFPKRNDTAEFDDMISSVRTYMFVKTLKKLFLRVGLVTATLIALSWTWGWIQRNGFSHF